MLNKDPKTRFDLEVCLKKFRNEYTTVASDSGFVQYSQYSNQTNQTNKTNTRIQMKAPLQVVDEINSVYKRQPFRDQSNVVRANHNHNQIFPNYLRSNDPSMIQPRIGGMASATQSQVSPINPTLTEPLNTKRLNPQRFEKIKRTNFIEIFQNVNTNSMECRLEYDINVKKLQNGIKTTVPERVTLEISEDGRTIRVSRDSGKQEYPYEKLPNKYNEWYNKAAKFVNANREHTPKITYYDNGNYYYDVCCNLMENTPNANVEVQFSNGVKIASNIKRISITKGKGKTLELQPKTIEIDGEFAQEWKIYRDLRDKVENLEKEMRTLDVTFPAKFGKRPKNWPF